MNLKKLIVASCAVLSMCAVHAETYTWNGTEGDFSSPTIWEGGTNLAVRALGAK